MEEQITVTSRKSGKILFNIWIYY